MRVLAREDGGGRESVEQSVEFFIVVVLAVVVADADADVDSGAGRLKRAVCFVLFCPCELCVETAPLKEINFTSSLFFFGR